MCIRDSFAVGHQPVHCLAQVPVGDGHALQRGGHYRPAHELAGERGRGAFGARGGCLLYTSRCV
ncbi:hypothetical protein [Arthrobacter sp. KBS0703]|uniref:hypothetical protein n=1 Tax=Arthrobacter sp. KBS0703 TaxID=1955698 RepID=UPI0021B0EA9B|nr:hypothetical protein [Arthrobacter sp. KBS0703]